MDSQTHMIILWCTECKRFIGTSSIHIGDTVNDGIHYWFGKEIVPGTQCTEDYKYICPNCEKGIVLFWCPMAEPPMVKLTYDPYFAYRNLVSDEDAKKFRDWVILGL